MRRRPSVPVKQPQVEALRLLGAWRRISQGHVAMSLGCSCGVAASNLRVEDFEEQILEYLHGKHGGTESSITDLLTGIAKAPGKHALAILADLEGTIESFEQQHSGR